MQHELTQVEAQIYDLETVFLTLNRYGGSGGGIPSSSLATIDKRVNNGIVVKWLCDGTSTLILDAFIGTMIRERASAPGSLPASKATVTHPHEMGAWTQLPQGKLFSWVRGPYAVLILLVRVVCDRLLVHQHSNRSPISRCRHCLPPPTDEFGSIEDELMWGTS